MNFHHTWLAYVSVQEFCWFLVAVQLTLGLVLSRVSRRYS